MRANFLMCYLSLLFWANSSTSAKLNSSCFDMLQNRFFIHSPTAEDKTHRKSEFRWKAFTFFLFVIVCKIWSCSSCLIIRTFVSRWDFYGPPLKLCLWWEKWAFSALFGSTIWDRSCKQRILLRSQTWAGKALMPARCHKLKAMG